MFFDGGSTKKAVDLRGKSKKEDRQALIARAEKAREERERQRQRQRAAVQLQACFRSHLDLRRASTSERHAFDEACRRGHSSLLTDGWAFKALTSSLLFFHRSAEREDSARRQVLMRMLLESAEGTSISTNVCAQLCSTADGAAMWQHQSRRLVQLALPGLRATQQPASGPPSASLELRVAIYLTESAHWSWASLLPSERQAELPGLAHATLKQLGPRGLHAAVVEATRALLLHGASPLEPSLAPLLQALLNLSARQLSQATRGSASPSDAWHFARAFLCTPSFLSELPEAVLADTFAPLLQPLLCALAADASRVSKLLPVGGAEGVLCANLVHLVVVCAARASSPSTAIEQTLGRALPAYVALLHGCLPSIAAAMASPRPSEPHPSRQGVSAASDSEGEPMDVQEEAVEAEGDARQREQVAAQLRPLGTTEHMAALWHAALAAEGDSCTLQLAAIFCQLLYGGVSRSTQPQPRAVAALSSIAFSSDGVQRLWERTERAKAVWGEAEGGALLCVFCSCFSQLLVVVEDEEFFDGQRPFAAAQLVPMCRELMSHAIAMHWQPAEKGRHAPVPLRQALLRLLRQLYDRDARRSFMGGAAQWYADASRQAVVEALASRMDPALLRQAEAAPDASEPEALRVASLLLHLPFAVPFASRLRVLRGWLEADRAAQRLPFGAGGPVLTIRRDALLADAFAALRGMGEALRRPLRVRFLGLDDLEEAGVGPGVALEFVVDVLKAGFDPAAGLFLPGADGALYPNPAAHMCVPDAAGYFAMLGAMLAKTLYEGVLVELPFANCFLNRLLNRTNAFSDLPLLDPQLHKSLMFLKNYTGDVEDLCLTFAIEQYADDRVPREYRRQVELKPGGADIPVTRENRVEYIFLVSHFRLNMQLKWPCEAFMRGFAEVVPPAWINMFSPVELQLVLGGSDAPLDVDDWRAHTQYSGGYFEEHPTVGWFWEVLHEFTSEQRAALLKFVTSCSRPPLMGFQWLQPAFCIHKATAEEARLPTSATCVNLLKLPPYDSRELLREKLIYAIEAGCGFELS
ncbi:hypothetical protein AB1Y20_006106 [Prymnesium parvum]|uniref:HECT-type E3 ubiquitin transferase n=1 Tax=Prymnesium parvum TaxID=97485 RepID=A0AB34J313_PRYPA